MSRHRNAYDKDELYDYDDEDVDYYDEDDDNYDNQYTSNISDAVSAEEIQIGNVNLDGIDDTVSFILEILNDKNAKVKVAESRVRQMLELYDYDSEKTLDYFLKQRTGNATTQNASNPRKVGSKSSSKSPLIQQSNIRPELVIPKNSKPIDVVKVANQKEFTTISDSISALGFNHDLLEISSDDELVESTIATSTPGNVDPDEIEQTYNLKTSLENKKAEVSRSNVHSAALPHLTVVVAGHVGNITYSTSLFYC